LSPVHRYHGIYTLTVDVKVPAGTYLTGEYGQARGIAEFRKPIEVISEKADRTPGF
jgi:hypothetical protein